MKVKTHKPNSVLWLIAFLLFVYALIGRFAFPGLPALDLALFLSPTLLLLGTTIV